MTEDKKNLIDPETGEVRESSQFKGDKEFDEAAANSEETRGGDDPDNKFTTDTEYRNTDIDEAGYVSGPTAEGRRTRVDEISENPSEDSEDK